MCLSGSALADAQAAVQQAGAGSWWWQDNKQPAWQQWRRAIAGSGRGGAGSGAGRKHARAQPTAAVCLRGLSCSCSLPAWPTPCQGRSGSVWGGPGHVRPGWQGLVLSSTVSGAPGEVSMCFWFQLAGRLFELLGPPVARDLAETGPACWRGEAASPLPPVMSKNYVVYMFSCSLVLVLARAARAVGVLSQRGSACVIRQKTKSGLSILMVSSTACRLTAAWVDHQPNWLQPRLLTVAQHHAHQLLPIYQS